jgi:ribosome recycling factor
MSETEAIELVLEEARAQMRKTLEGLHKDLSRIRTGRANPAILEGVHVDYYGTPTPLRSLATISAPEPRLLALQPFDPNSIPDIERAILKADLGLTTTNDGKLVRVPIPELTMERRKSLVKNLKKQGEEHKVGVRSARRDAITLLKGMQDEGEISEDDSRRGQAKVQELTDEFIQKLDEAMTAKEKEILTV